MSHVKAARVATVWFTLVFALAAGGSSAAGAATFSFSTGSPDGKMAMASRPDSSGKSEIEAADDFALTTQTSITHATFTGLLPSSGSVQSVVVEIYRVFPLDSNTSRTIRVPTRVNSPSDNDFQERDSSSSGQLRYSTSTVASSFTAQNSVLAGIHPLPNVRTGGEGPVTGREVTFNVTLTSPFTLPAGHYFFVPQVQVSGMSNANFYWLSTPHPGPTFPAGVTDLQAWIRNSALEPDWLRVGTDIVGGTTPPTFNAAFSINNAPLSFSSTTHSLSSGIGVQLSVKVPAAGKVRADDPLVGKPGKHGHKKAWFNAVTVTAKRAGTVHLKVVPNQAGRKQLAPGRTVHVLVRLAFTPPGGQSATHEITVTWRRK